MKRREEEVAREFETHIAHEAEELMARGIPRTEALLQARRRFGNPTSIKETVYEMNPTQWLDTIGRDLRYGLRQLRLSPGFTLTAILSLALGIGANTAIFQLIDAVQLRSLPVKNPEELVQVKVDGGHGGWGVSNRDYQATNPLFQQIREHQQAFSGVFGWGSGDVPYGEGAKERPVPAIWLGGDAFRTLGMVPYRGRLFTGEEDHKGCTGPAVISYRMWQREFGGDDKAIGTRIFIANTPLEIVGVTPPEFYGLEVGRGFDVAFPDCARGPRERRHVWDLFVMGRLKPGSTVEGASQYLKSASKAWFEAVTPAGYDSKNLRAWFRFRLTAAPAGTGISGLRKEYERSLWLLLGITGLVLLIACANLANLLLARAAAREREIAVRLALGASRARLIAQLLSESLLLAAGGALVGTLLASRLSRVLLWFLDPEGKNLLLDLSPDWRLLLFTASVGTLTCVLFGLAPAIRATRAVVRTGARGSTADRRQFAFQRLLITAQIAISLVLLVGAVLFVRSFRAILSVDPGFRQEGIVFNWFQFGPPSPARDLILPMKREALERIRAIPGIEAVATSTHTPLNGSSWTLALGVPSGTHNWSKFTWVTPGFFHMMGIPLISGRDFTEFDTESSPKVLLVNKTFVQKVFRGESPIGKTVRSLAEPGYKDTLYEIVGVVADTKYDDLRTAVVPIAYGPELQNPQSGPWVTAVARTTLPPDAAAAAIKKSILERWPTARMNAQSELRKVVTERLVRERMLAWLSGFFGALACLLAMLGLYGVISYMTARRRKEIGIRLALGSSRGRIAQLVLRQVLAPLAVGSLVGGAVAFGLAQTASTLLFGIEPRDAFTFAAAAAALGIIALTASLAPALRAARLNPVSTLRQD